MLKELFNGDHTRLIKLLDKFLADNSKESLIEFIGNIKRHIKLENDIIYKLSENKELQEVNKKILTDHTEYEKIIQMAESVDIERIDRDILRGLRMPLSGHNAYEDKYFYPILDNILSEDEKADLADKVRNEVNFNK